MAPLSPPKSNENRLVGAPVTRCGRTAWPLELTALAIF